MYISKCVSTDDYELEKLINKFIIGDVKKCYVTESMYGIEKVSVKYESCDDLNKDLIYLSLIKNDFSELEQDGCNFYVHPKDENDNSFMVDFSVLKFNKIYKELFEFEITSVDGDGYGAVNLYGEGKEIEV